MTDADWERDDAHALGVFLNGEEIPNHDREGNPIEGASFLMLFNAHHEPVDFEIPAVLGSAWVTALCSDPECETGHPHAAGERLRITSRSLRILRRRRK
jgi:glycogen operon protein